MVNANSSAGRLRRPRTALLLLVATSLLAACVSVPPTLAPTALATASATPAPTTATPISSTTTPVAQPPAAPTAAPTASAASCPVAASACAFGVQLANWVVTGNAEAIADASVTTTVTCNDPAAKGFPVLPICEGARTSERRDGYAVGVFASEGSVLNRAAYLDFWRSFLTAAKPTLRDDFDDGAARLATIGCAGQPRPHACQDGAVYLVTAIGELNVGVGPRRLALAAFAVPTERGPRLRLAVRGPPESVNVARPLAPLVLGGAVQTFPWAMSSDTQGPGHFYRLAPPPQPAARTTFVADLPTGQTSTQRGAFTTDGRSAVWLEAAAPPDKAALNQTITFWGLALDTGKTRLLATATVAEPPGTLPQAFGDLAGRWLVWERPSSADSRRGAIVAYHLASGQSMIIADDDGDHIAPHTDGHHVVWTKRENIEGLVMYQELRPMTRSQPMPGIPFGYALGSDFVVYVHHERAGGPYSAGPWTVHLRRLGAAATTTLLTGTGTSAPVVQVFDDVVVLLEFDTSASVFRVYQDGNVQRLPAAPPREHGLAVGASGDYILWQTIDNRLVARQSLTGGERQIQVPARRPPGNDPAFCFGGGLFVWLERNLATDQEELHAVTLTKALQRGRLSLKDTR